MKIGNLDIGHKLFLAPMAEVTDASFRTIAKNFGAGLTFTQMVSAQGVIKNNFESLRLLSFARNEKPIGVQILGNDPGILSEAVKEINKLKPDLIDLNCGCPVDKVTKVNMGANLLENPQLLATLVKSMVMAAGDTPVSVKVRLGKDRKNINIIRNARIIEENGAALMIVHTRAKADKYDMDADWEWLKKVKQSISIPVVGNGSAFHPYEIKQMVDETGCDSVMVARGALGNPFLFQRFNTLYETGIDPGLVDIKIVGSTVVEHLNLLKKEFGDIVALPKAKKNIIWYFQYYDGISVLLKNIFSINDYDFLYEFVNEHVHKIENKKYPKDNLEEIERKFRKKVLFWLEEDFDFTYQTPK